MRSIDELWRQVVESPGDVDLRLVLADALIEQGDPRGELIALQCRGADARVVVDREADGENAAERVNELVATHWDTWLGELAELVIRQESTYADGMLSAIRIGGTKASVAVWERAAQHRELCAVRRVRPLKARAEQYGAFLAGLVHDPHWVEVPSPHVIRVLRGKRKDWRVRELRYGGFAFWSDAALHGVLTSEVQMLSEIARDLEVITINPAWLNDELVTAVLAMPRLFPRLRKLQLANRSSMWREDISPSVLTELDALPILEWIDDD